MMKNSEGNVKLSFCNMESHSGYDNNEMEQPIGYLNLMIESNTTKAKFKQLEEEFQQIKAKVATEYLTINETVEKFKTEMVSKNN